MLKIDAQEVNYNLAFTDCEYHCSRVVEDCRPDFIVIDCALGNGRMGIRSLD